eukprot:snap_masked-scaffold_67-processed-gene-0.45-mRNA-1 protein AED:1.00 eAED:1.00 QI:0/0/0/0/1/1/2/0/64
MNDTGSESYRRKFVFTLQVYYDIEITYMLITQTNIINWSLKPRSDRANLLKTAILIDTMMDKKV